MNDLLINKNQILKKAVLDSYQISKIENEKAEETRKKEGKEEGKRAMGK